MANAMLERANIDKQYGDCLPDDFIPFKDREHGKTICLFDVDGTLTPPRGICSPEMYDALKALRRKYVIASIGGSDMAKQDEQLGHGIPGPVPACGYRVARLFDFCFAENGLVAIRLGEPLPMPTATLMSCFPGGQDRWNEFVSFALTYIGQLNIPCKRGTFIELRRGMVNISPIGRNASPDERRDFEIYDTQHAVRSSMIQALRQKFPHCDLVYATGGQISIDVYPRGWDKCYCLRLLDCERADATFSRPRLLAFNPLNVLHNAVTIDSWFSDIRFYGDKTMPGGNDHSIYQHAQVKGTTVTSPSDTLQHIHQLLASTPP